MEYEYRPGGQHILTAKATDQFGLFSFSAPVTVTVDNSSPPLVIGIDTTVFRDTQRYDADAGVLDHRSF